VNDVSKTSFMSDEANNGIMKIFCYSSWVMNDLCSVLPVTEERKSAALGSVSITHCINTDEAASWHIYFTTGHEYFARMQNLSSFFHLICVCSGQVFE
jgi:hypothetical protein